jgi:hypothetical protein
VKKQQRSQFNFYLNYCHGYTKTVLKFSFKILLDVTESKGVFRESGNYSKIEDWIKKYEKGEPQSLDEVIFFFLIFSKKNYFVEDVAGIFLHYYHTLPNPLIKVEQLQETCAVIGSNFHF